MTTEPAAASRPFSAGAYLRDEADIAAYLETVLEDGDARVEPVALRTVAEARTYRASREPGDE